MFKIQENADGSTSVYHKETGQHLCTIPVKPNSSSPLRINVVEPQPSCNATVVVKDWRLSNFKTKVPGDSSTEESSDEDLKSSCRVNPAEFSDSSEALEDPKMAFVRALNLLPPSKGLGGRTQKQWPLRMISRVEPRWPRLVTDLTPLSCQLGRLLLSENPRHNLLEKEMQLVAAVRKYEGLCVAAGLPPSEPNACHVRLRCRDRRVAYLVSTTPKTVHAESTHVYTYGRRQRLERMKVIETGLDHRSRRLLSHCRDCKVVLDRLSKSEIKRLCRRPQPRIQPPSVPSKPRSLSVRLPDVTRCISRNKRDGYYYLAGTSVRVLNYGEFLAARKPPLKPKNEKIQIIDLTLDSPPKKSTLSNSVARRRPADIYINNRMSRTGQLRVVDAFPRQGPGPNSFSRPRPTQSHSSSRQRPGPKPLPRPIPTQLHSSSQQRAGQVHVTDLVPRQRPGQLRASRDSVSRQRSILRSNDSVSLVMGQHGPILRAMLQERQLPTHFRCFACGCNRYISGSAECEVLEHMRRFHSVTEPDRFLTVYRDQVKRCTIVEAFPGYKGNID